MSEINVMLSTGGNHYFASESQSSLKCSSCKLKSNCLYNCGLSLITLEKLSLIWMDGNFELLDAEEIEDNIVDWWKSLNRLSKSKINEYYHPMNLLNYLYNKLEEFKEYLPMISALRTKGISDRHWTKLSEEFKMHLDPATL